MNKQVITECNKCGKRFNDLRTSTPCCKGLSMIVNKYGNTTKKVFLSTLNKPQNGNHELQIIKTK